MAQPPRCAPVAAGCRLSSPTSLSAARLPVAATTGLHPPHRRSPPVASLRSRLFALVFYLVGRTLARVLGVLLHCSISHRIIFRPTLLILVLLVLFLLFVL